MSVARGVRCALILVALLVPAGCSDSSPSSPSGTTTTVPNTPAGSESFSATLNVQGTQMFTFSILTGGTVNVTLASVTTNTTTPQPSIALGLGLGSASTDGTTCNVAATTTTTAGLSTQLTGSVPAGTGCVTVSDVGQLTAPVTFAIRVAHS
jgi:hypothetical protein